MVRWRTESPTDGETSLKARLVRSYRCGLCGRGQDQTGREGAILTLPPSRAPLGYLRASTEPPLTHWGGRERPQGREREVRSVPAWGAEAALRPPACPRSADTGAGQQGQRWPPYPRRRRRQAAPPRPILTL